MSFYGILPTPPMDKKLAELKGMSQLAETDPGMEDLLNRAREYYILKGSPMYRKSDINHLTDFPGPM